MKPWIQGAAAAAIVVLLYPARTPLRDRWKAMSPAAQETDRTDSVVAWAAWLDQDSTVVSTDTALPPSDPFGLPPAPIAPPATGIGLEGPLPLRTWAATGRVGQRAAVLTASDGRILVISNGSRVDSAVVVSIGAEGVTLEDRGGRFVLQIP